MYYHDYYHDRNIVHCVHFNQDLTQRTAHLTECTAEIRNIREVLK